MANFVRLFGSHFFVYEPDDWPGLQVYGGELRERDHYGVRTVDFLTHPRSCAAWTKPFLGTSGTGVTGRRALDPIFIFAETPLQLRLRQERSRWVCSRENQLWIGVKYSVLVTHIIVDPLNGSVFTRGPWTEAEKVYRDQAVALRSEMVADLEKLVERDLEQAPRGSGAAGPEGSTNRLLKNLSLDAR